MVFLSRKSSLIWSSSFLTSTSTKVLFFLNHTLSFSSSWSLKLPCWISTSKVPWTVVSIGVITHSLSSPSIIGLTSVVAYSSLGGAYVVRVLHMVLYAQRTTGMCRSQSACVTWWIVFVLRVLFQKILHEDDSACLVLPYFLVPNGGVVCAIVLPTYTY